jgi:hypothetical protein
LTELAAITNPQGLLSPQTGASSTAPKDNSATQVDINADDPFIAARGVNIGKRPGKLFF